MAKSEMMNSTIGGAVEEALTTVEELRDELQSWLDNLPEQFQDTKGEELQEAIDALEEAISDLETAQNSDQELLDVSFQYCQIRFSRSTYMSRAKRLELSTCALGFVPGEVPSELSEHENASEFEEALNSIANASEVLGSVSFPAMR